MRICSNATCMVRCLIRHALSFLAYIASVPYELPKIELNAIWPQFAKRGVVLFALCYAFFFIFEREQNSLQDLQVAGCRIKCSK